MAEAEVKKREEGIKKDFLDRKTVLVEQDGHDYVDKPGDYCREFIGLMHCMGPFAIKEIADGGVVHLMNFKGEHFPGKVNGSRLKPYISGLAS